MDAAGRFYSHNNKFDTYDHNQAYRFRTYHEASTIAKRNKATVEIL